MIIRLILSVCLCSSRRSQVSPQQYGLQVGSSVNVMSGPGGPGPGGAGPNHPGQGPYAGQNMQYHGGEKIYPAYTLKPLTRQICVFVLSLLFVYTSNVH